jgi:electron transfer flavoprotein beta subunit
MDGNTAKLSREIDGGKENLSANLPLVIGGQKGLVEESDLRIPNMRGIMQARSKPLQVIEPSSEVSLTSSESFEKPAEKSACKLVDAGNEAELVSLLHNQAKVI